MIHCFDYICTDCQEKLNELVEALEEIKKGEGRFSIDRLEHATNAVKDMQAIAHRALEKIGDDEDD